MSYPYLRYNGEADAEAHIRAYLTTWQANHALQRLASTEANISKIVEFGQSLEGQATGWYSRNDITEIRRAMLSTRMTERCFLSWDLCQIHPRSFK